MFPHVRELSAAELPPPGASPFHLKGTAYRNTVERHARSAPGREAVRAQLPTDALRSFYDQTFLVGGWYDVFPVVAIDAAFARTLGLEFGESLRVGTRSQANEVLHGVYRPILRLFSPKTIAWALPRLIATYYDFGQLETNRAVDGAFEGSISGVPAALADWYAVCSGEFVLAALELSGAKSPRIEWVPPKRDGARASHPLVCLRFTLTWG
jgi:hypothetical protein